MSHFHPELRRAAWLIPRVTFGPRVTRWANRLQRGRGTPAPPSLDGLTIRDETIAGGDGQPMRVRLYLPAGDQGLRAAMVWIHGGGMIIGTPEQDQALNIELCRDFGIVIVAAAYRLAVDAPYPAPMEDCYAALNWLHSHADKLKVSPDRIAVGGNSAGAGLAAGLALLAQDRRRLPVSFQLLIYPMLDDRTALRADVDDRRLRLWDTKSNRFGWTTYLGRAGGGDGVPDYAAPARRKDLRGAPAAWIGVGTCDLFHDEDVDYARRLTEAGVPCTLKVVDGAFHGFDLVGPKAQVVRGFRDSYLKALSDALGLSKAS
jgi:acetyl esterase/lipase